MLMISLPASADGFSYEDLNYEIVSEQEGTVEVVGMVRHYPSDSYPSDISIPDRIIYSGKTYRVTKIGYKAFFGCTWLTSVTIPNSVTEIDYCAFKWCTSLTSVTIPDSVTGIGLDAFYYCTSLASVTIPNSVKWIDSVAFMYCSALTSVTIGDSVTKIGNDAFTHCDALICIYNLSTTPVECKPDFTNRVLMNATLYVPTGNLARYQKVDPWRNFWNIEEKDFSGIEDITINEKSGYNVYNLQGVQVLRTDNPEMINTLPAGIYIVNGKKMVVK